MKCPIRVQEELVACVKFANDAVCKLCLVRAGGNTNDAGVTALYVCWTTTIRGLVATDVGSVGTLRSAEDPASRYPPPPEEPSPEAETAPPTAGDTAYSGAASSGTASASTSGSSADCLFHLPKQQRRPTCGPKLDRGNLRNELLCDDHLLGY